MPTNKQNQPGQNQSQSSLEDDIKAPTMEPARKMGDADIEGGDRGRVNRGLDDEGAPLRQRDEDVPTRQGDELGDDEGTDGDTEAAPDNDAGYDGGAKSPPR